MKKPWPAGQGFFFVYHLPGRRFIVPAVYRAAPQLLQNYEKVINWKSEAGPRLPSIPPVRSNWSYETVKDLPVEIFQSITDRILTVAQKL
jgi:hypothetical protein